SEQQDSDIAAPNAELEFCQPQHMHYHQFQHPVECAIGISQYRELGDQKAQRGAGLPETGGGGVTPLMDGQQQDAEEFLSLYLNALDEELPTLLPSISGSQSASAVLEVEEHEASQSGQTEVGSLVGQFGRVTYHAYILGKSSSHVRTSNKPDVTTEDWRSLHLDIQHDSIHTIHIPQPQSGEQVSASGLAMQVSKFSSRRFLQYSSSILTVFNTMRPREEDRKVDPVGPELEITLEPPHYKLYGVLYHHSESAGSGHCTVDVDVLHSNRDGDAGEVWPDRPQQFHSHTYPTFATNAPTGRNSLELDEPG
ncbi:hypothetical protein BGY98DRAFT_1117213, partial [Russula aff. rugulosa BPL654]